ncbi:MAG: fructose-bisphosphate aldolase, class II [Parcubacteria group bacterium Gr01-1014_18]|nr:MAG: fructose-bisphosphate aldolase, class II [Parcubacteria group bacterium Greene0416_36]TSC80206.1 MAG: fructose-bisphosphate aldolase, class II [Parcubacteria group bacterium Gr01-1014_18]TSC98388.1 MAG: fructose-bisphosphate aldolase, class II [Parcubacteria group bacterium Greene1014_20]TSD06929.1 MAG: fructose-bisphosphate aldolase, class II [Parcubacteria group bacterium Greene0714_2]
MLVSGKSVLQKAQEGRYAVGAFNVNNLEILRAVIEAAVEKKSPVFIQTSEGAIDYAGIEYLSRMIKVAAKAPVSVVMHLDHGKKLKYVRQAIRHGYTSVMMDASHLSYEDNISITQKVVALASKKWVSVEAELGMIKGVEDKVSVDEKDAILTHPDQAADFVARTGCDSLAVAIGTSHGAFKFKQSPKLDIDRLGQIRSKVSLPLVLHGASAVSPKMVEIACRYGAVLPDMMGNSDEEVVAAVRGGVCKVNIDTDLRLAFCAGVREYLAQHPSEIDPRKFMSLAKTYMKEIVMGKMDLLGSANKINN